MCRLTTLICRSEFIYGVYGVFTVHRKSATHCAVRLRRVHLRILRIFSRYTPIYIYIFSKKQGITYACSRA
jgi:hypothetical protein